MRDDIKNIYSSLSEICEELSNRSRDQKLGEKVSNYFDINFPTFTSDKPIAFLSRTIATPNLEMEYFLDIANTYNFKPVILEYDSKFIAKNPEKYHLCKLYFYKSAEALSRGIVNTERIVDFNKYEGSNFSEINTKWGESLKSIHRDLWSKKYHNTSVDIIDFTKWFNLSRTLGNEYYSMYLSLFICNGVLFENFIPEDKEECNFISERLIPSMNDVVNIFGVKPLIFPLLPMENERNKTWYFYEEKLKQVLAEKEYNSIIR
jgi:hypothetical protein